MRINYWSCSKFADWLRGTPKPYALGWKEWDDWREEASAAHPVRYWVAETLLKKLQNFVCWPKDKWNSARCYFRNRFIDKTHYLRCGLKPGEYADTDYRIMHALFEAVVDYVEIEISGHDGPRRSRENGLKHLDWEISLIWDESSGTDPSSEHYGKPTHQAVAAAEVKAIYLFWKDVYPNHKDAFESDKRPHEHSSDELRAMGDADEAWEHEIEDWLIRVIKARRNMWS